MNKGKNKMKNKKGLEMSFVWIFAIIVGAIIIFFAIYFATQYVNTAQYGVNTKTAKEFTNLFDPLQGKTNEYQISSLPMLIETKVFTNCNLTGDWGENRITLSEKSNFGVKKDSGWTKPGGDIGIKNQYIFAENEIKGKTFYFFTVPFQMPFKIADLMIVYTEKYCFIEPPEEINSILGGLGIGNSTNIEIKNLVSGCDRESIKVCFSENIVGCDIKVICENNCENGVVKKTEIGSLRIKENYFVGDLVYGAIFGSPSIYDCNVKRIIKKRLVSLAKIYVDKAQFVSAKGCNTGLVLDMEQLETMSKDFNNLRGLDQIKSKADEIDVKNTNLQCQLY